MSKSKDEGFDRVDFIIEPHIKQPDISDNIQLTLARLLAWDNDTKQFRRLTVDDTGRLLISTSPTQTNSAITSVVVAPVAGGVVLADNPSRKQYILQNTGSVTVYIGFDTTPDTATDFPLPVGGMFADDVYTGVIYCRTVAVAGELRVIEM